MYVMIVMLSSPLKEYIFFREWVHGLSSPNNSFGDDKTISIKVYTAKTVGCRFYYVGRLLYWNLEPTGNKNPSIKQQVRHL
jgi:hypothetical protein